MTRLDRIIKGFNDYDNLVKKLIIEARDPFEYEREIGLTKIRNDVSLLVGELKRYGCRRER